eukprot:PhF_6_TR19268/c0_g1_i5/m.28330
MFLRINSQPPMPYEVGLNHLLHMADTLSTTATTTNTKGNHHHRKQCPLPKKEDEPAVCTVQLLIHPNPTEDPIASATFKLRTQDLYFLEILNEATGVFEALPFSVSYTRMEDVGLITSHTILNACLSCQCRSTCTQKQLRIIIFVIAEAAHFEIIRRALIAVMTSADSIGIDLLDFDLLVHSWSALRKKRISSPIGPPPTGEVSSPLLVTVEDLKVDRELFQFYESKLSPLEIC